jgi:hypothetical protein
MPRFILAGKRFFVMIDAEAGAMPLEMAKKIQITKFI